MQYLKPFTTTVDQLVFVPGTSHLVSIGGKKSAVGLYDAATGRNPKRLKAAEGRKFPFWGVTASPDGRFIVAVDSSLLFHVWSTDQLSEPPRTVRGRPFANVDIHTAQAVDSLPKVFWESEPLRWRVACRTREQNLSGGLALVDLYPETVSASVESHITEPSFLVGCRSTSEELRVATQELADSELHLTAFRFGWGAAGALEFRSRFDFDPDNSPCYSCVFASRSDFLVAQIGMRLLLFREGTRAPVVLDRDQWLSSRMQPCAAPVMLPDDTFLAAMQDGRVRHYHADPDVELLAEWEWDIGEVHALSVSADGQLLAAAGERVVIWDRE